MTKTEQTQSSVDNIHLAYCLSGNSLHQQAFYEATLWMNLEGTGVQNKPVANPVCIVVILLCVMLSWHIEQIWAENVDKSK